MKKKCFFLFLPFLVLHLQAQFYLLKEDSLAGLLKTKYAVLSKDRVNMTLELMGRHLPDEPSADSLRNRIIEEVETSRDRELMCLAYNAIARNFLNYYDKPAYYEKAKFYIDKCMQIATESGRNDYKVSAMLRYAKYYVNNLQNDRALSYNNQAISLATTLGSDSLLCLAYSSIADTWKELANKLSEFQALLNKREFAEKSGIHFLMVESYYNLGAFYRETDELEKSKDYYTLAINKGKEWGIYNHVFNSLLGLGRTYLKQQNDTLGVISFNRAIAYADSTGMDYMKINGYFSLLNHYFNSDDPAKGLAYLNSQPLLIQFVNNYGVNFQLNKLYAALQVKNNNYDSALYYMRIAEPHEYSQKSNFDEKFGFTIQFADILKMKGDYPGQKQRLLLAKSFADSSGSLTDLRDVSLLLDSVYNRLGDYKNAEASLLHYNVYKDSLETLGKQKDLLNIEIENSNKRAEQQKIRDEETLRLRNNLQYLGITAAIATLFIILVVLGVFKMSPAVIKAIGFFAFIFLFEFIILLLDEQIHDITHGEPWKVLSIKIFIIALLLPLHHWLEEKVLHYLTSKAHRLKPKFFQNKGSTGTAEPGNKID